MTIVNQQLHPENDPDTIIHPETSPSQAGVALYEHRIVAQVISNSEDKFTVIFNIINTKNDEYTLETLVKYTSEIYSYSFGCFGSVFIKADNKNYSAFEIYFFKDVNNNNAVHIEYVKNDSSNLSDTAIFRNVTIIINDNIIKII